METQRQETLDALASALRAAHAAVEHDPDGQGASAGLAQRHYNQALSLLEPLLEDLPEPQRAVMQQHCDAYRLRLRELGRQRRTATGRGSSLGTGSISRGPRRMSMSRIAFQPMSLRPPALEPRPSSALRRPFWTMRRVGGTLSGGGGYLTEKVFVPRMVFSQDGCKIPGMSAKVTAFESVVQLLAKMEQVALPRDRDSITHAAAEWVALVGSLAAIQNNLSRPFPFISEVEETKEDAHAGGSSKSNLAHWGSMVASVGRSVRKQATTAYERLGAAVPGRVTEEELGRYTHLLSKMFDGAQFVDTWVQLVENSIVPPGLEDATDAQVASLRDKIEKTPDLTNSILRVCDFFRTVIVELVMRDVEVLLERYLRKTRKAFARMYWDVEQS